MVLSSYLALLAVGLHTIGLLALTPMLSRCQSFIHSFIKLLIISSPFFFEFSLLFDFFERLSLVLCLIWYLSQDEEGTLSQYEEGTLWYLMGDFDIICHRNNRFCDIRPPLKQPHDDDRRTRFICTLQTTIGCIWPSAKCVFLDSILNRLTSFYIITLWRVGVLKRYCVCCCVDIFLASGYVLLSVIPDLLSWSVIPENVFTS